MTAANYTDADLKTIAAISDSAHYGLLTSFGLSIDEAKKIVASTTDELTRIAGMRAQVMAKFACTDNEAFVVAKLAAVDRELIIRS